jgi:putative phosphotransacetylase
VLKLAKKILVETSARHMHISAEHLAILFGEGHELTNKKDLSQPGQYACEEKVTVVGPKGEMKVSILGPVRKSTQIELSLTDARMLGVTAPIRESGDTANSAGLKIVGPKGSAELNEGVIIAKRHIHLTPDEATELGVNDKQIVYVKVNTNGRTTVFGDVVVRVNKDFAAAMHIDTDEANSAGIMGNAEGEIIEIG